MEHFTWLYLVLCQLLFIRSIPVLGSVLEVLRTVSTKTV
uniref:Uncharacterized protein n=1 Tax=Lepeophtheirus salmonis TaxID=72036 RepID=A0A0K2TJ94_LEPSM